MTVKVGFCTGEAPEVGFEQALAGINGSFAGGALMTRISCDVIACFVTLRPLVAVVGVQGTVTAKWEITEARKLAQTGLLFLSLVLEGWTWQRADPPHLWS
jgi:hypothetical protein